MTTQPTTDVLIVGTGAAGLTLALDLARRGVPFLLIDKLDAPFRGSRGKGLQPRTQEVFDDLGLVDRLTAAGGFYPPQRVYQPDGSWADSPVMEASEPHPGEPYRNGLLVPQFMTEAVMRERLAEFGERPLFGCELVDFVQDDDGVSATCRLADGSLSPVRARYLVGADGGRSSVRRMLSVEFPGKTLGVRAMVADVHLQGLSRDAWHRFNDKSMERQLAICPLWGTDLMQVQAPVPMDGEVDLSAAGLNAMIAARTGRSDIVVDDVSWASAFQMNARLADRYRVGRVFLVGDAAHTHPPTGGQGLNTSVQDSYNLGWKLAAVLGGAPEALLDSYEEERRPVAAEMLGLSTRLLDEMKQGELRRGREVQQLDLSYRGSSLASLGAHANDGSGPRVTHGDRAPDAKLLGAGGQTRRLFDLFRGPHWTLLGFTIDPHAASPAPRSGLRIHHIGPKAELQDDSGHVAAHYSVQAGDWVLVRPDGYIGAIASTAELPALEAYAQRMGLVPATQEVTA